MMVKREVATELKQEKRGERPEEGKEMGWEKMEWKTF